MSAPTPPEPWLRGPVPDVPPLLQPSAHALLQTLEDVRRVVVSLDGRELWARPGGAPSVGFHLRHATGSLDRLFTYARGESLNDAQRAALAEESSESAPPDAATLVARFETQVERSLAQLRRTDPSTLLDARPVGRGALPSTVLGLLFHAAEHTQRHTGQIVSTARIVRSLPAEDVAGAQ